MDGMPKPKHAIPAAPETRRRDHLWVLFLIAACVLAEVWASWVGIGAISGFPVIKGKIPTDWVLAVAMEAYWGYALYAWLVASPGPKSRAMAMWSCGVVFALSLAGQVLYHELTVPPGTTPGRRVVIGFVTSLPVIVLALIAVLIHMRHADREDAEEAARRVAQAAAQAELERAEADENASLRAELDAAQGQLAAEHAARMKAQREAELRAAFEAERNDAVAALEAEQDARQAAETARADAEHRAEGAEARAERLSRKLGANSGASRNRKTAAKGATENRTKVPNDVDARLQALGILADEPGITGKELGERCGRGERWGQLRKSELAGHVADGGSQAQGDGG